MKKFYFGLLIVVLLAGFGFSQSRSADIYGTCVLPDGSAIPGVAVQLTGDVIGKKTTVTSEEGNFRFLSLPPGNYELKFDLEGFHTIIRKNIRLYLGKNITMSIQMETAPIKEEIVITEKAGVVDTRKTTVGVNVSKEMIQSLPTARNPWTVLNLIPGMMVDREDVGGNESGQQSSFYGHGVSDDDTTWNVDGGNVTDPSAIGAAPAYLNMNNYEELQVTLGSNDIKAQTGGTQLNFVSKRAGNNYSGDFHLYVEDEAWEYTPNPPEELSSSYISPGIMRLYQYGINFGGPVIKDKLWWYGAYGIQDIHSRTLVGDEDATWLLSGYLKANFQTGNTSGEFLMSHDAKKKWGRTVLSRAQQDSGSLYDQDGPGWVYQANIQHILGNLMLNAKVTYTDGGFVLDPRGSDINPDNGHNEGNDFIYFRTSSVGRYYKGSQDHYETNRNSLNLSLDGNYFAEGILGADHEIRFGVDYYTADTTTQTLYPNQRIAYFYNREAHSYPSVWLTPDRNFDVSFERISFYLSDTASFGRLTANLGVRFDNESGMFNGGFQKPFTWYEPGTIYHGITPAIVAHDMRALDLAPRDPGVSWSTISPRLSLTYDITGDGKNVIKLSAARYGSQSGNNLAGRLYHYREIDFAWNDANADEVPNYNELDWSYYYWDNMMFADADGYRNISYDPDYNTSYLDELTIAFEKEVFEDFAVSVNGFYKMRHNLSSMVGMMPDGSLETKANWYEYSTFTFDNGDTVQVYGQDIRPIGTYYTNYKEAYDQYMAIQLIATKKLSKKWMLDASFTYMDWKAHRDASETLDMNNFDYFQDGVVAPQSGGSGLSGIYVNARWQAKLSGLVQLPWGVNFTGVFQAREGYVIPHRDYELVFDSNTHWQVVYHSNKATNKFGDDRLPTFWMLNLGLEKSFKISDTVGVTVFVDGYNVTNNQITLKVNPTEGSSVDAIQRILNPGIFQFGIRVKF